MSLICLKHLFSGAGCLHFIYFWPLTEEANLQELQYRLTGSESFVAGERRKVYIACWTLARLESLWLQVSIAPTIELPKPKG